MQGGWVSQTAQPILPSDLPVVPMCRRRVPCCVGQIKGRFPRVPWASAAIAMSARALFRDAVLPLVPMGDDILDERRGRGPQIADRGHEAAGAALRTAATQRVPGGFARIG